MYTLTLCPSRIVIVGGMLMNRSRIVVALWERLDATPYLYASAPFPVRMPPLFETSAAPAMIPSAMELPKIPAVLNYLNTVIAASSHHSAVFKYSFVHPLVAPI